MATMAWAIPVLPGKEQLVLDVTARMREGADREEYLAARRANGFQRETAFLQQTPQGSLVVVVIEAEDPERVIAAFGSSEQPFDKRFRDYAMEAHGVDFATAELPKVTPLIDERF